MFTVIKNLFIRNEDVINSENLTEYITTYLYKDHFIYINDTVHKLVLSNKNHDLYTSVTNIFLKYIKDTKNIIFKNDNINLINITDIINTLLTKIYFLNFILKFKKTNFVKEEIINIYDNIIINPKINDIIIKCIYDDTKIIELNNWINKIKELVIFNNNKYTYLYQMYNTHLNMVVGVNYSLTYTNTLNILNIPYTIFLINKIMKNIKLYHWINNNTHIAWTNEFISLMINDIIEFIIMEQNNIYLIYTLFNHVEIQLFINKLHTDDILIIYGEIMKLLICKNRSDILTYYIISILCNILNLNKNSVLFDKFCIIRNNDINIRIFLNNILTNNMVNIIMKDISKNIKNNEKCINKISFLYEYCRNIEMVNDSYNVFLKKRCLQYYSSNEINLNIMIHRELNIYTEIKLYNRERCNSINTLYFLNDLNISRKINSYGNLLITSVYWEIRSDCVEDITILSCNEINNTYLGKHIIEYIKKYKIHYNDSKLLWYLQYGVIDIEYKNKNIKMLPIQFLILELITLKNYTNDNILKLSIFVGYKQQMIQSMITSLITSNLVVIVDNYLILSKALNFKLNLISLLSDNSYVDKNDKIDYPDDYICEIIMANIKNEIKKKSLTYGVLMDNISHKIKYFTAELYNKVLKHMLEFNYIKIYDDIYVNVI